MIRITVAAPAWAIVAGIAQEGEERSRLFGDLDVYEQDEFRASGTVIEDRYVNADTDEEMFIRGWES